MTIFFLAREIGTPMIERLELVTLQPKLIANLGCETEYFAELLKKRYADAEIKNFAEDEILPFADHSVDLIFANLFLPWCKDLNKIFREWRRVLRPEGLLMFSSFGPDTLIELRENHANEILINLVDMHNLGDELTHARFADPVMDVEYLNVTYRELKTLMQELQATNMLLSDVTEVQLTPNDKNVFSLTYEIVYGHAWGPDPGVDHVADEEGVVRIPLSHLRRGRI